jgi:DNA-binding response OmpR family regulator
MKLLVVEDSLPLATMMAAHMRERGFAVTVCLDGAGALAAVEGSTHDAAVLDLGLPDIDGLDVLRGMRAGPGATLPVVILTARDRIDQRIAGLDAGADDYVLKPFDIAELEARLRAVLRRPGPRLSASIVFGDITYDPSRCGGSVGAQTLDLTRREAALLEELLRNGERIVVRDRIADRLYGVDGEASGNAIEATVSRLRRKLGGLGSSVRIEAMRGIGYRLRHS